MMGTFNRIKKLEARCEPVRHSSLDTLVRQAAHLARHTGFQFEEAAEDLVRDLSKPEFGSAIAEAELRYGKEVFSHEQAL